MSTYYNLDKRLEELTQADVLKTYNGRLGCACGCRGKYTYLDASAGSADRGYPVGLDEVSPRRVQNVIDVIKDHIDEAVYYDYGLWEYETETRAYRAYLKRGAEL